MKRDSLRRFSALVLAALWAGAWACSSDDELAPVGLAKPCSLNSDCKSPLVCVFRLCHAQCKEDRDCGGEQRCVAGYDGNVCQLEGEIACSEDQGCKGQQVCGADGECRDLCRKSDDCTDGQLCANSGECASKDPTKDKVDSHGNIQVDPFGGGGKPSIGGEAGAGGEGGAGTGGTGGSSGGGGKGGGAGMAGKGGTAGGAGTFGGIVEGPLSTDDCPEPSGEITVHSSEVLTEAASWSGVHRISGYLRVDAPLVLEPCAVVGLDSTGSITVRQGGSLRALGVSGGAVTITSSKATASAGDWVNIDIQDAAANDSLFQHTIIGYGGPDTINLEPGASAGFSHVYVHDSAGTAIASGLGATLTAFDNVAVERAADVPVKVRPNGVVEIESITSTDSRYDEIGVVVDGPLERAATWRKLELPYRVMKGSYSVLQLKARLDIDAGSELRMETGIQAQTDGALVLKGVSGDPVTLTSTKTSPMGGDWPGIVLDAESSNESSFEHAIVEYAGAEAISVASGATISLSNTTIRSPSGVGVVFDNGAVVSLVDNVVVEDAGDSAFFVCSDQVGQLDSVTSTGSVRDEIKVYQNPLTTPASWKNHGIPYRLVTGTGSIGAIQAELTLEAGVTILMDPAQGWNVSNGGSIKAMGTMADPIVIKSSAASPGMAAWGRITFAQSASTDSTFSWTTISDGNSGVVTIDNNSVTVTDVTFSNNATCDVALTNNGMLVDGCTCMYTPCS